MECRNCFNHSYQPDEPRAANYSNTNGSEEVWYTDTGATDHITADIDKLSFREKYAGRDKVHAANGSGMDIRHVGRSIINTPDKPLSLNNVLHVPKATKNLVSAHRLTCDNDVYLEIHPWFFSC